MEKFYIFKEWTTRGGVLVKNIYKQEAGKIRIRYLGRFIKNKLEIKEEWCSNGMYFPFAKNLKKISKEDLKLMTL